MTKRAFFRQRGFYIFLAINLFFSSCKEDKCAGITCQNGGTCDNGACVCPKGFKGSFCETVDLAKYTITNKTPSSITLWVGMLGPFTVASGSSYTYEGKLGSSFEYYAEAVGRTSSGTEVGNKLTWTDQETFANMSQTTSLVATSTWFFLKIRNNTTSTLNNLYVNYGLASQTYDAISGSPGGPYNVGYYKAFSNGNVRMYVAGSSVYYEWKQGQHYNLPFTENQTVTLTAN